MGEPAYLGIGQILLWTALLLALSFLANYVVGLFWKGAPRFRRGGIILLLGLMLFCLSIAGFRSNGLDQAQSIVVASTLAGIATVLAFLVSLLIRGPRAGK